MTCILISKVPSEPVRHKKCWLKDKTRNRTHTITPRQLSSIAIVIVESKSDEDEEPQLNRGLGYWD